VFKASYFAGLPVAEGALRWEVFCLHTRWVIRANGLEQHKVQNEVWLAK
jgi:hypothetical protein